MSLRSIGWTIILAGLLMTVPAMVWAQASTQDQDDLAALGRQVATLVGQGRVAEAAPMAEQLVQLSKAKYGEGHQQHINAMAWLADICQRQGRMAEAEAAYKWLLATRERTLGPNHNQVAEAVNQLGMIYRSQGRWADAEAHFKRAMAIWEKAVPPHEDGVSASLANLADVYRSQGRLAEAEVIYKRALVLKEQLYGHDSPRLTVVLGGLALLYKMQGRLAEAEAMCLRDLAILRKTAKPDSFEMGASYARLGDLYYAQGRYAEAVSPFEQSASILEKLLGPEHQYVATAVNNLASAYLAVGKLDLVEPLYQRTLATREKRLGPDHPDVGESLNNLAQLYVRQSRFVEAERLTLQALAVWEKSFGTENLQVSATLANLAALYFAQARWADSVSAWKRSTDIIRKQFNRSPDLTGKGESAAVRIPGRFRALVKASHRLAEADKSAATTYADDAFMAAQWAVGSEAAESVAQMALRQAKGTGPLASLVRERQDLVQEWQVRDKALTGARTSMSIQRNPQAEALLSDRMSAIDRRVAEIDKRLVKDFPEFATLSKQEPLSLAEAQQQLGLDEAMVLLLDTSPFKPAPEETFVWVVTKMGVRWVRSTLGTQALTEAVAALRCGLDAVLWEDDATAKRCRDLVKSEPKRGAVGDIQGDTLPFDTARAHAVYKSLFGEVEELIRGKHLLVVPSGPLTQLPFQVLVTTEPKGADLKSIVWLAKSHAITILPAVTSLKALRRVSKASAATKAMIGFGNPLLDGNPRERPWEAQWAKLARDRQSCTAPAVQVAEATRRSRGAARMVLRGGRADLDHLRSQSPLYDTADELCAVANALQISADDILLGSSATEVGIKQLSESGRLAQYRVVHFATHGTLAGEIEATAEPGLILTPPKEQSDTDDGYLSASEVASLKLDADWVILSACNTAAGGAKGAEALSGLARAFIYAGARALLVSHWAVDSAATVKLITAAVSATARDTSLGRAEALRQAMLTMIDGSDARQAHPAYWAPFVVVGEGAAAK